MADGAILRGYAFSKKPKSGNISKSVMRAPCPLLCLASELGNSREYQNFAVQMAGQLHAPERVYTLDMRGRGRSDYRGVADSDIHVDVEDLISFCDAHNLHNCDVIASGYSAFVIFLAGVKRPALVRKLILNDAAPQFDDMGLARRTALNQRARAPENWDECVRQLREQKGEEFPEFNEEDWISMARLTWRDQSGKPVPEMAKNLERFSNLVDYDQNQPNLWNEFKIYRNRPILLIRGENSPLVTEEVVNKVKKRHPRLQVIEAKGQGHVPQLERGTLVGQVLDFLLKSHI